LARESIAQDEADPNADMESLLSDADDDKTYAAMGIAKTIGTVCGFYCSPRDND
jgi:hypothetical protein